jgi:hypothetical protein
MTMTSKVVEVPLVGTSLEGPLERHLPEEEPEVHEETLGDA